MPCMRPSQQSHAKQGACDGSHRIHRPVETNCAPARVGADRLDHDGIAQRTAQALAKPEFENLDGFLGTGASGILPENLSDADAAWS